MLAVLVCVNDTFSKPFSKHTKVKMLFTILLIVSSKKINIAKNVNCDKK